MSAVVLDENQYEGVVVDCDQHVAALVEQSQLVSVRQEVGGAYRLMPRGKVGAVRVGGLQVEVHPKDKVGMRSVFFLLGYASNPGWRETEVFASASPDLFEAMAESLVRQTWRALERGVYRGYVPVDETGRTVRGRIRMSDQVTRHFGSMYPVEITYDDFSPDVPENRIVLTALRRVAAFPRLTSNLRSRVLELEGALDGVTPLGRGEPTPYWAATRLNERYHGALRLAELLLKHCSITQGSDARHDSAAFVVSMDRAFEDFVAIALSEALAPYAGEVRQQYPCRLDEPSEGSSPILMRPDVVHVVDGVPVMVADAKYKAASAGGEYPNADKYQMLAYCTALQLNRAWLVYAQGGEPVARRVQHSGIEIIDWPLDLSSTPRDILQQVDELAEAIAAHAALQFKGQRTFAA